MPSLSERVYQILLYLYPSDFRQAYGDDMRQLFRDMHRDAQADGLSSQIMLWGYTLIDIIPSLITEHLDQTGQDLMTTIKIDQYEVKRQLDTGSTSHIYLVNDPVMQRDVIMKLWQPDGDFDQDTLKQEVDAMIALKHPNIPEVYAYVENDHHPYYVMEYIEGETLLQQIEASEMFLSEDRLIAWGIQLCDILLHVHQHQPQAYLFRDVKPSNIILDSAGDLHLIDFGITVQQKPDHEYNRIGTIGYSAPEQYIGQVDIRSDVYGLGVTLHHLATRIDPRPDHNPSAQPFTFAPVRSVNPNLSRAFANIIATATAYEPEDRFPSVQAMKVALIDCMNQAS